MSEARAVLTNWAGNLTFHARALHEPSTVDELRRVVARAGRVRALGTRHSFSPIADTDGELVSVAGLPPAVDIDAAAGTVAVAAGIRYGELAGRLHAAGYALHNLGSLPHISVAGACATGTHGSGDGNGGLATAVRGLELVTADGDVVRLSREDDPARFPGSVVALGALGIVTRMWLNIEPTFSIAQFVYDDLPWSEVLEQLPDIFGTAYSVSLFTDWAGDRINQVWLKQRPGEHDAVPPIRWLGGALADGPRHPVPGMRADFCTQQGGAPGPWHERLPHFRLEFTPSAGDELQSEFLIAREHARAAVSAVAELGGQIAPVLQISEIRTVAGDDLWLSPSFGRDSVGLHFTWVNDEAAVRPVLAALEERLSVFAARPHWGKLFDGDPKQVAGLYPRMDDFVRLAAEFDPAGKFRNPMLDRYLGAGRPSAGRPA